MSNAAPLFVPFPRAMARFPAMPIAWHGCIARLVGDDRLRLAIATASLSLADALERKTAGRRKSEQAFEKALLYAIRSASRCTPFGLFAGAAIIKWGDRTNLELSGERRSRTRIDMALLLTLVSALEATPEVRRRLKVVAHPAAQVRSGRLVLAGIDTPAGPYGEPNVSLRATSAVRQAIESAKAPLRWTSLRQHVRNAVGGASVEQVEGLLTSLWRHGFLITSLRPPLVNEDPATHLLSELARIEGAKGISSQLSELLVAAQEWDREREREGLTAVRNLARMANALVDAKSNAPIQVDTAVGLKDDTVHSAVGEEAARLAELLIRMSPYPSGPPVAGTYYNSFVERYGADACIPLLELVDIETGLVALATDGRPRAGAATDGARGERLVRLAWECQRQGRTSVELTEELLGELATWDPRHGSPPRSLDIYARVSARSPQALDEGRFQVVVGPNIGSNSAGRNLGRFSGVLPGAEQVLREMAREEPTGGAILAELLYPPERPRSCNVVLRSSTRDRSVGVITSSAEVRSGWISLQRLFVCTRKGRLLIVTPDTDGVSREVVAVAGHMLNHVRAPLVCRFLADIARAGQPLLCGFDWGPASRLPMLPRIEAGRVVLSPAQWRLDAALRAAELRDLSGDFQSFRERFNVPRYVHYRGELDAPDKQILIDLENDAHRALLTKNISKSDPSGAVVLQEALPAPDDEWVPGPDGAYSVEFVVSLLRRSTVEPGVQPSHRVELDTSDRLRPPGTDWLYVKIYLHPAAEDGFIAHELREFASSLIERRHADSWMYLRYSDPKRHLRVRFHGTPRSLETRALPLLIKWLGQQIAETRIDSFQIDTYEREIERYGGAEGTSISERLFAADSECCAELLAYLASPGGEYDRVELALIGLHDLVRGLESDPFNWALSCRGAKRPQTQEFRSRKAGLIRLLERPGQRWSAGIGQALAKRWSAIERISAELHGLAEEDRLGRPIERLLDSYAHLFCNRILGRDRTREHELIDMYVHCTNALRSIRR